MWLSVNRHSTRWKEIIDRKQFYLVKISTKIICHFFRLNICIGMQYRDQTCFLYDKYILIFSKHVHMWALRKKVQLHRSYINDIYFTMKVIFTDNLQHKLSKLNWYGRTVLKFFKMNIHEYANWLLLIYCLAISKPQLPSHLTFYFVRWIRCDFFFFKFFLAKQSHYYS